MQRNNWIWGQNIHRAQGNRELGEQNNHFQFTGVAITEAQEDTVLRTIMPYNAYTFSIQTVSPHAQFLIIQKTEIIPLIYSQDFIIAYALCCLEIIRVSFGMFLQF